MITEQVVAVGTRSVAVSAVAPPVLCLSPWGNSFADEGADGGPGAGPAEPSDTITNPDED